MNEETEAAGLMVPFVAYSGGDTGDNGNKEEHTYNRTLIMLANSEYGSDICGNRRYTIRSTSEDNDANGRYNSDNTSCYES